MYLEKNIQEDGIWNTKHIFYFNSKSAITAKSLADNLMGLDGIGNAAVKLIEKVIGIKAVEHELLIESVALESYKDQFWFRIIFGQGKKAEEKLEKFREHLKLKDVDGSTIARFAIAGSILYGCYLINQQNNKGKDLELTRRAETHIENSFNNMAVSIGMSGDEMKAAYETTVRNKEQLKKDVMKIARPDGQKLAGKILIDGDENFAIPDEIIESLPDKYEKTELDKPEQEFPKIEISLRAIDLDKPESGWWALVPDLLIKD